MAGEGDGKGQAGRKIEVISAKGDKMEGSEEPSQPQLHIPVLLQLFSKACPTPPCLSPLPTP